MNAGKQVQESTQRILTSDWHDFETRTPSRPGGPPASITGDLAASISVSRDGNGAKVGPTAEAASHNGPYGRFLELGGEHLAHAPGGYMRWVEEGRKYKARHISKAPRPFLKPGLNRAIGSGAVGRSFYNAWLKAQMEAE